MLLQKAEERVLRSELNFPLNIKVTALSPSWKHPRVGHIEKQNTGTYFYYQEKKRTTFQYMDASWRVWKDGVEVKPYLHDYGTVISSTLLTA